MLGANVDRWCDKADKGGREVGATMCEQCLNGVELQNGQQDAISAASIFFLRTGISLREKGPAKLQHTFLRRLTSLNIFAMGEILVEKCW